MKLDIKGTFVALRLYISLVNVYLFSLFYFPFFSPFLFAFFLLGGGAGRKGAAELYIDLHNVLILTRH
ncbi:hypothetical protein CDL12_07256 [Handroanthus impetiginosus]|uniref:Uncharacterized protein n=1 Tax=Handroanthus impetiginosus TaxID=429701 RepID=A0A2G9HRA8_9LAMI|nr:hypothetical protein CDL12_07256 [Handroanthus impetiginosus]